MSPPNETAGARDAGREPNHTTRQDDVTGARGMLQGFIPDFARGLDAGDHRAPCPACNRGPNDDALSITVEPDGGGVWTCHRCHDAGNWPAPRNGARRPVARAVERPAPDFAARYERAAPAPASHGYLVSKRVQPHPGVRVEGDALLLPMRDASGALVGLQTIAPDGSKRYARGSRKVGARFTIGRPVPDAPIYIAEGYATAASLHEATGHATVVAFDCGNLAPVARLLRERYPAATLILCADNDAGTPGNPGLTAATEAARAVRGLLAIPPEAGDFNDMYVDRGADAVRAAVEAARAPHAEALGELASEAPPVRPVNILRQFAAPPLTADDAPPLIADFAAITARAAGFDPTMTMLYSVIAVAAMLSDDVRIRLPGASSWFESARLWGAVVAGPGAGKTPAERQALAPVRDLHRELARDWEAANLTNGEARPDAPPRPRLFVADTTIEAMVDVLRDNPRGVLIANDELESWLGSHDAYRNGSASRDRGEWLRLYDGGQHQVERVRRGTMFVRNWGCSIASATTPAVLRRLARFLPSDGLIQRFMLFSARRRVAPDTTIMRVQVNAAAEAYHARLREIYGYEADVVRLSAAARERFESEAENNRLLVDAMVGVSELLAGHLAKHTAMLARVALAFHAAACGGSPAASEVSGDTMRLAARFMARARQHAVAIYADLLGAGSPPLELARAIAQSVLAEGLSEFNRRRLTHACRAFRPAAEADRRDALQSLADFGWLIARSGEWGAHGTVWTVNPAVHELFRQEAEEARARREAVRAAVSGVEP